MPSRGCEFSKRSFYILGAGETPAPQQEAVTTGIVVQGSSLLRPQAVAGWFEQLLEPPNT